MSTLILSFLSKILLMLEIRKYQGVPNSVKVLQNPTRSLPSRVNFGTAQTNVQILAN